GINIGRIHKVTSYILLCVIIAFCTTGIFSWLLVLLLPENYAEVRYIVIACLAAPLLYTLSEATVIGIGISRRTIYSMLSALIAFIFNLAASYWLIPIYGAAGAAVSTAAAFL